MRKRSILVLLALSASVLTTTAGMADGHPGDQFTYVTVSDGTELAMAVSYPPDFRTTDVDKWPTIYVHDFYDGGGRIVSPSSYGNKYVTVHTSVRGTGCSQGRFDLFDERHALDGYDVIEGWIVKQPWSNGKVGIVGHSGPGLVGFMVAATNPPSVKASALSGLIDDLYRGIVNPGGVSNGGFPLLWTVGFRPFYREHPDNSTRYIGETSSGDARCMRNIATRPPLDPLDDPVVQGVTSAEYDAWWAAHSNITRIGGIGAPMHITQQYQDEQTGPRGGPVLWERLPAGLPKRLVLTNGDHGTNSISRADRRDWLDCFIIHDGKDCAGDILDPSRRVRVHFETQGSNALPPLISSDYPLPETVWTDYYLQGDGQLRSDPWFGSPLSSSYVSAPTARQNYQYFTNGNADSVAVGPVASSGGPDELEFRLPFTSTTAMAGPATATFFASSTGVETDFFVELIDQDPDGNYSYLQRGMLRASHRAVDGLRSDRIKYGARAGEIYRPHRPHTNTQMLVPGETYELLIEIFPFGHVFRPGHELLVKIHAAPASDSFYNYLPAALQLGYGKSPVVTPSVNTIFHDAAHPSRLMLPVLPPLSASQMRASTPACGTQAGVRCVKPLAP